MAERKDGGPGGDVVVSEGGVVLLSVTAAVETVVRTEPGELCVVALDVVRTMLALVVGAKLGGTVGCRCRGSLDSATLVNRFEEPAVSVVVKIVVSDVGSGVSMILPKKDERGSSEA